MVILSFIFGAVITFFALGIVSHCKDNKPKNKVHFYVARDKKGILFLFKIKPVRMDDTWSWDEYSYVLDSDMFPNLKWEDEPVKVFLNLED